MVGCSKDHGKEIDLYNKSYEEKILRVQSHLSEAIKSENDLQKRSYYYAQALLVFYYLIPDDEKQEKEVQKLQFEAHSGQAETMCKMKRYEECFQQIQ